MTLVAGADVTKGRWVVIVLENGRFSQAVVAEHLIHLRQRIGQVEMLALDIPIGLPDDGGGWPRKADLEARDFIGPRRSSVFSTPPRPVFDVRSYAKANLLHRDLTGKGLSRQSWALGERILEAEFYVSENPNTIEVHPEVCFRALNGKPLAYSKKTWNGQTERRHLIAGVGIDLPEHLPDDAGTTPPDDVLDAAAAAWTAWRVANGEGSVLPESAAGCDQHQRGVIWY